MTLTPNSGFSTVTVSGIGFYGLVTISWDGTPIPTVPEQVFGNNNGGFSAVIVVPTQTTPGGHIVNATDQEFGPPGLNASFVVIDMKGAAGAVGPTGPVKINI